MQTRAIRCLMGILLACLSVTILAQPTDVAREVPPQLAQEAQEVLGKLIDWKAVLKSPEARKLLGQWLFSELNKIPDVKVTQDSIDTALSKLVNEVEAVDFRKLTIAEVKEWIAGHLWNQLKDLPEVKAAEAAIQSVIARIESEMQEIAKKVQFSDVLNGKVEIVWHSIPPDAVETIIPMAPSPAHEILTVLKADRVGVSVDGTAVSASGEVSLTDPFGYLRASDFAWNWVSGAVSARDIGIRLHPARGSARMVSLDNSQYKLEHVQAEFLAGNFPLISASAKSLVLNADQTGTIEGLRARILGIPLLYIRKMNLNYQGTGKHGPGQSLLERIRQLSFYTQFLKPPSIGRQNGQITIGYDNTVTFSNRYQIGFGFKAARDKLLESQYSFNYNLSRKSGSGPSVLNEATVRDDYTDGFVENVSVRSYRDDVQFYRQPRSTILANAFYNSKFSFGDDQVDLLSKPLLVGYEFGGPINRFGGIFQVRYENVHSRSFGNQNRFGALGSIYIFGLKLRDGLNLYGKIDGSVNLPDHSSKYGFVRPRLDLIARFLPWLRVSGALVNTLDYGTPFLPYDAVMAGNEVHTRLDLLLGPLQISYGNRYSFVSRKWYRAQIYVSDVVGAFEPFVGYDQYLNSLSFGIYFRLDEMIDSIRRRKFETVRFESKH